MDPLTRWLTPRLKPSVLAPSWARRILRGYDVSRQQLIVAPRLPASAAFARRLSSRQLARLPERMAALRVFAPLSPSISPGENAARSSRIWRLSTGGKSPVTISWEGFLRSRLAGEAVPAPRAQDERCGGHNETYGATLRHDNQESAETVPLRQSVPFSELILWQDARMTHPVTHRDFLQVTAGVGAFSTVAHAVVTPRSHAVADDGDRGRRHERLVRYADAMGATDTA